MRIEIKGRNVPVGDDLKERVAEVRQGGAPGLASRRTRGGAVGGAQSLDPAIRRWPRSRCTSRE